MPQGDLRHEWELLVKQAAALAWLYNCRYLVYFNKSEGRWRLMQTRWPSKYKPRH